LKAATLYQRNPDVNHVLWNVATYEWKVHNGKIEIISFVVKFVFFRPSLSLSRYGSRYDAHVSIPNEFGGLRHVRVKKLNTFSQIPRQREKS
jgi:hypothetical protein